MFDLKDKVCLVTGASRSIGLGLVRALLKRGTFCLLADVDYRKVANSSRPLIVAAPLVSSFNLLSKNDL